MSVDTEIPGYTVVETLHAGPQVRVVRARREHDGRVVVIKQHASGQGSGANRLQARLRHEYDLLQVLEDAGCKHSIRLIEGVEHKGRLALVLEDISGYALSVLMARAPFSVAEVIKVGMVAAEALGELEDTQIIHKDINPSNIVLNTDTGAIQLIDFGIATRLSREVQAIHHGGRLAGTVAYLSPEQTGRMNRPIDYRTDFYSLGATLYTLLAGEPPFGGAELMTSLHIILTVAPTPLQARNPSVPPMLAALIEKLLAKAPEERYQSARGIYNDLQRCHAQLQTPSPTLFTLGVDDYSPRFELSPKLHGRSKQLETLHAQLTTVRQGNPAVVLVDGVSGSGKSALIKAFEVELAGQPALFAAGKFDETQRNVPLRALTEALTQLLQGILAHENESVSTWRQNLLRELGAVASAVVEVVPALEWIIGKTAPPTSLGPREQENRLLFGVGRLLRCLAKDRPVVLFFDDLQWADHGTAKVLEELATMGHAQLLILGAYRNPGLEDAPHVLAALDVMRENGARVTSLRVGPLSVEDIAQFIADTVRLDVSTTVPLAEVVHAKTGGIAYFVSAFLLHLWHHGMFAQDQGRWNWDLAAIRSRQVTDNMTDVLREKISQLPPDCRTLLEMASCLGGSFALSELAAIAGRTPPEVAHGLWPALRASVVLPRDESYRYAEHGEVGVMYDFAHDKIHESLYAGLSAEHRSKLHHTIGQALAGLGNASDTTAFLRRVEHVNLGCAGETPDEAVARRDLNVRAGELAQRGLAYDIAIRYLRIAAELLPPQAHRQERALWRAIYRRLADCTMMARRLEEAHATLREVLSKEEEPLAQASVLAQEAHLSILDAPGNALGMALDALQRLGAGLPERPSPLAILPWLLRVRIKLLGLNVEALINQPVMTDPHDLLRADLLSTVAHACVRLPNTDILTGVSALQAFVLTLDKGRSPHSALTYAFYSVVALRVFGDIKTSCRFRDLALQLAHMYPCASTGVTHGAALFNTGLMYSHPDMLAAQNRGYRDSLESGELFGGVCFTGVLGAQSHVDLDAALANIEQEMPSLRKRRDEMTLLGALVFQHFGYALQGRTPTDAAFGEGRAREEDMEALLVEKNEVYTRTAWYINKLQIGLLHGDIALAQQYLDRLLTTSFFSAYTGLPTIAYVGALQILLLVQLAQQRGRTRVDRPKAARRMWREMRWIYKVSPQIGGMWLTLARAELAALAGDVPVALANFDEAAHWVVMGGDRPAEIVVLERAGRFHLKRGAKDLAQFYLSRAMQSAQAWGASVKLRMLQDEFPAYTVTPNATPVNTAPVATVSSATYDDVAATVDLAAVLRACQLVSRALSTEDVVRELMRTGMEVAGADGGLLVMLNDAQELYLRAEAQGGQPTQAKDERLTAAAGPETLLRLVQRTREAQVVSNAAQSDYAGDAYVRLQAPRAMLCAPILRQGELIGLIYLENRAVAAVFTRERLRVIELIAAQAAISLENARLYTHLEATVAQRTEQLRRVQDKLLKLERDTTETQMAGGFAHEVLNALSPGRYAADSDSVQEALQALPSDHVLREAFVLVEAGVTRGLRITQQILEYAALGRIQQSLAKSSETTDLGELVSRIVGELTTPAEAVTYDASIMPQLQLPVSQKHAWTIVRHLIVNARDAVCATDAPHERRVTVRGEIQVNDVVLQVEDTGVGMSQQVKGQLFRPFFSTKGSQGMGLGLGLSKRLVELYGGSLEFASQEGAGATFRVRFPRTSDKPPAG